MFYDLKPASFCCVAAVLLLTCNAVFAADRPAQSGQIETAASPWDPVPTDKISLPIMQRVSWCFSTTDRCSACLAR